MFSNKVIFFGLIGKMKLKEGQRQFRVPQAGLWTWVQLPCPAHQALEWHGPRVFV